LIVDQLSFPDKMQKILAVARQDSPADLLLKNCRLIDVLNSEIIETNLAVQDSIIAAVGSEYTSARKIIDLEGKYAAPGLIDAHLHIESTLLFPPELARVLIVNGTTCVINDPHEIANVLGIEGVKLMLDAAPGLPCDFYSTAPSCVPATDLETSGGKVTAAQVDELLNHARVVGLGEMMNYPGIINGEEEVLAKVAAAHQKGKVVDGHAPGLTGTDLQTYLSAGISTDHECITAAEAEEKIRSGMKVIIRHGSASSSLAELLPLVNSQSVDAFMFGSDDREAGELLNRGHLNELLKTAVSLGADPLQLLKIATVNAAKHYRLFDRGLLAPGFLADLVVFEDLKDFKAELVIKNGRVVAESGKLTVNVPAATLPEKALNTVNLGRNLEGNDFKLPAGKDKLPVIGVVPGQLATEKLMLQLTADENDQLNADPDQDIIKIAVVERHKASGRLAVALVKGMGLREGAIASSVAHDSHNILVAGVEEKAMAAAVNELARTGGGFTVVNGSGHVQATLPLPVAGLMSDQPAAVVAAEMDKILSAAKELGTKLDQPFLTLAFLALPVIPSLKITDHGLFDVDNFRFI